MKYFELKCTTFLKQDINFIDSFDVLSKYINFSMCQKDEYKDIHNKNIFKNYCFGSFYPTEKSKIYKQGNTYSFVLRSINENFINDLQTLLRQNIDNSFMQVLQIDKSYKKQFFISELYTVTPVIVSVKDEKDKNIFWTVQKDGDILKLQKQIQDNLLKKYESFYNEKLNIDHNFIQFLEIKNHKPQIIFFTKNYNNQIKRIKLFGNKFRIIPNEDELSQKLAFMSLSCGLGEKQSYGAGLCLSKELR